jgi:uncharacterized protein (TIGR02246 family)
MKTTETLVRELADLEAIRDLSVRYCDCLSRDDIDGLLGLFTDDATYVVKGTDLEAVFSGRAEIKKMHEKALAETKPRLFVHTQLINLLGSSRATSRCCVEVRNLGLTAVEWLGVGYFEDEYVKLGEQWKFAVRHHGFEGDAKVHLRMFLP